MSTLKRLYAHLRPYLKYMALAAIFLMAVSVVNLAILWVIRHLVNAVMMDRNAAALASQMGILLVLFMAMGLLTVGHSLLMAYVSQRVVTDFRIRLFEHLEGLSLDFFAKRRIGEILSRLSNDVGVIQNVATTIPVDLAKQSVTLLGGLAILFYMNWRLCLLVLGVVPFVVLAAKVFGRQLKRLSTQVQDEIADTSTILEEVISGIRIVKSFARERYEAARFARQVRRTAQVALEKAKVMAFFIPVVTVLTLAGAAGVLWYGGQQVIRGTMSPGDLVAFVLYGGILMGPFSAFARLFSQVKEVQGATERVFEILDTHSKVVQLPAAEPMPIIIGHVAYHGVSFQYDIGMPVLKNVSFQVKPGQTVALVGPSGAGKTTLVNLLHRFYDPIEGWIEIDGRDIRKVQIESIYRQMGLVPQETILFGGTIRENILYGKLDATQDELISAARSANAHDFIMSFPKGYDTIVGEKGINLSGGQRQRIAIARAILKDPKILILDEATSSLDNESERLIQEALERLMKGRTTFVIAHRLTTIQSADLILVLDKGQLVEQGTHAKLLDRKGLYHNLHTIKLAGIEV
jgi:subfamily B ATP-binding cassette protein MsbA